MTGSLCRMIACLRGLRTYSLTLAKGSQCELIGWDSSRRLWVRPCMQNIKISETSRRIAIKFYQKYHWGGGNVGPDQIETLVSMATDLAPSLLIGFFSFLQVMMACIKAGMSSKFGQI